MQSVIQQAKAIAGMAPWWGTREAVSTRLRLEVEAMRAAFGSTFRLVVPPTAPDQPLYWEGVVQLNLATLTQPEHTLKILYPAAYPNQPAEAYVLKPRIFSQKHQFEDGQLCLFNPRDGEQYGWNPSTSTAVTVAAWAIQWLYAYYTWRATGTWPGVEEHITEEGRRAPRRGPG
jgi:ubiquitin-protein ligase